MPDIINQYEEVVPVDAIRPHPKNPNKGSVASIRESIRQNGFFGWVLVQASTDRILVGEHRWRAARAEGLTEIPVTYLDVTDEEALRILLVDNKTAEEAVREPEGLAALLKDLAETDDALQGTGYTEEDLDALIDDLGTEDEGEDEERYTKKIETPIYEPSKPEPPPVESLYDAGTTDRLIDEIRAADLPEPVERFLTAAAFRHTVFDFEEIAEFYAHADPETQDLMERSALVIIDFEAAIEQGFVNLSKAVREDLIRNGQINGA